MIRSFIAIELRDEETVENIGALTSRLKKNQQKLKIVEPQNLHITIKFLGDIQETLAPQIYSTLMTDINEKIFQGKVFQYKLKGIGQFNKFAVLWVKINGNIPFLQNIKDSVEDLLHENFNIARDKRTRFKPHLTIGRLKKGRINYQTFDALKKIIADNKDLNLGVFNISQLKLKKSQLTPKGPIYSDLVY